MILLSALALGLLIGLGIRRWNNQPYPIPELESLWLAMVAFVPQFFLAYLPATHSLLPNWIASALLSMSLLLFLVFVWRNRRLPGMPVLLAGLLLNLIVILANGGWMPISPQTASQLIDKNVLQIISLGSRFGQKDILLLPQSTNFEFLADRFLLRAWSSYQTAFSAGDVLIAIGAFWLLARPAFTTIKPLETEGVII